MPEISSAIHYKIVDAEGSPQSFSLHEAVEVIKKVSECNLGKQCGQRDLTAPGASMRPSIDPIGVIMYLNAHEEHQLKMYELICEHK